MKTNSFNAKKMLMSTLAAVAFSFVFTTNADAGPRHHRDKWFDPPVVSKNAQDQQENEQDTNIFTSFFNFICRGKC